MVSGRAWSRLTVLPSPKSMLSPLRCGSRLLKAYKFVGEMKHTSFN